MTDCRLVSSVYPLPWSDYLSTIHCTRLRYIDQILYYYVILHVYIMVYVNILRRLHYIEDWMQIHRKHLCCVETSPSGSSSQVDGESQRTFQPWDPGSVICTHTGKLNSSMHTQNTTSGHSAVVLLHLCLSLSMFPMSLFFFLLHLQVSHCNRSSVFCTRTTTWSVSLHSAMHWRGELHSRCGSGMRRFKRTSWNMS